MSADGVPVAPPPPRDRGGDDLVEVVVRRLPLALYERARAHHEALLREFEFIAHSDDRSSLPPEVVSLISAVRRGYASTQTDAEERIARASAGGTAEVDVVLEVPPSAGPAAREIGALLDRADALCRQGALLTVETPAEVVAFRRWYLGEISRQVEGEQPTAWSAAVSRRRS